MRTISLHVPEDTYDEYKSIAARTQRPVAAVIREAMERYLDRERRRGPSVLDLQPSRLGPLREPWTRSEVLDEMLDG